jgi:arylformamidase
LKYEFLSWPFGSSCPAYGGGKGIHIEKDKSLTQGDSCNSMSISFSNHSGTHLDAPLHFIEGGRTIDEYSAGELIHENPVVLELPLEPGRLIQPEDFDLKRSNLGSRDPASIEALLLKTGFCEKRMTDSYIYEGPGFSGESAQALLRLFPKLRFLGIDFLSVNRWKNRPEGRAAHMVFLGYRGMLICEDMDLRCVSLNNAPKTLFVAPLRLEKGDGAPATVFGLF